MSIRWVSAERMLESGMRWVLHFPEWQLQLAVAETETKSHGIKKIWIQQFGKGQGRSCFS